MTGEAAERVVLVDDEGRDAGSAPKLEAHQAPGRLHRAFSVFVYGSDGRLLLQRRAPVKYHFAGRWSNTCCGHPRPGETPAAGAARRLAEELGLACALEDVGVLRYEADDPASGLSEREVDHLFAGVTDAPARPDPSEVDGVRRLHPADLAAELAAGPASFTPWLAGALAVVEAWRSSPRPPQPSWSR